MADLPGPFNASGGKSASASRRLGGNALLKSGSDDGLFDGRPCFSGERDRGGVNEPVALRRRISNRCNTTLRCLPSSTRVAIAMAMNRAPNRRRRSDSIIQVVRPAVVSIKGMDTTRLSVTMKRVVLTYVGRECACCDNIQ